MALKEMTVALDNNNIKLNEHPGPVQCLLYLMVTGENLWNSLPDDITSSDSRVTFCRQLKAKLYSSVFRLSYSDICG